MTNEQLAALAQQGDRRALFDLWEAVKPFCMAAAGHVYRRHDPAKLAGRGVTLEDLQQETYCAFRKALAAFKPERAYKFTTYLSYPLKNAFAQLLGYGNTKRDPLDDCLSFDAPAGEDNDAPLSDVIEDPEAAHQITDVEDDCYTAALHTALDPYLYGIADEMMKYCRDRKTVVFLPLVKTSQKFRDILNERGFCAAEVNGESTDRAEILEQFDRGDYNVLCNSMLLTEGWDCPSVDCVVVLRPTKVRSLYSQMVGRGTRLYPGKDHLLLLDFLWHTERHELCHPANLICENEEVAQQMTRNMEEAAGAPVDLEEAEKTASEDVVAQREEALAKQLNEMRSRKKRLVDPLQFEMSIQAEDLSGYVPAFGWEMSPPSEKQISALQKFGIFPDEIGNAGKAAKILDRLEKRRMAGLTTPKQIRFLEGRGFQHVGTWSFETARGMIDRIAANNWRTPYGIDPKSFRPEA